MLQEAGIDAPHETRIVEGHSVDHLVLEPRMRPPGGKFVHHGRIAASIDGPAHHDQRLRHVGILLLRQQGNSGQHGNGWLAYRHRRQIRAQEADELLAVVDVVVQVKRSMAQRDITRVYPIGDVHVEVLQHRADGVTQQRGKVARQRSEDKHLASGSAHLLAKMDQAAKGLFEHRFDGDRHFASIYDGVVYTPLGLVVGTHEPARAIRCWLRRGG